MSYSSLSRPSVPSLRRCLATLFLLPLVLFMSPAGAEELSTVAWLDVIVSSGQLESETAEYLEKLLGASLRQYGVPVASCKDHNKKWQRVLRNFESTGLGEHPELHAAGMRGLLEKLARGQCPTIATAPKFSVAIAYLEEDSRTGRRSVFIEIEQVPTRDEPTPEVRTGYAVESPESECNWRTLLDRAVESLVVGRSPPRILRRNHGPIRSGRSITVPDDLVTVVNREDQNLQVTWILWRCGVQQDCEAMLDSVPSLWRVRAGDSSRPHVGSNSTPPQNSPPPHDAPKQLLASASGDTVRQRVALEAPGEYLFSVSVRDPEGTETQTAMCITAYRPQTHGISLGYSTSIPIHAPNETNLVGHDVSLGYLTQTDALYPFRLGGSLHAHFDFLLGPTVVAGPSIQWDAMDDEFLDLSLRLTPLVGGVFFDDSSPVRGLGDGQSVVYGGDVAFTIGFPLARTDTVETDSASGDLRFGLPTTVRTLYMPYWGTYVSFSIGVELCTTLW